MFLQRMSAVWRKRRTPEGLLLFLCVLNSLLYRIAFSIRTVWLARLILLLISRVQLLFAVAKLRKMPG